MQTTGRFSGGIGAGYVFTLSGGIWQQQAMLVPSDVVSGDGYGARFAISGSRILAGAFYQSGGLGAAYLFTRSGVTWLQTQKLTASDGVAGDQFGQAVAFSGTTALVGAPQKDNQAGTVYMFGKRGSTWVQRPSLTASDRVAGDLFGFSLAISAKAIVVGAPTRAGVLGAVYVYRPVEGGWVEQAALTAADGVPRDQLGFPVVLSGTALFTGAIGKNSYAGAFYAIALPTVG